MDIAHYKKLLELKQELDKCFSNDGESWMQHPNRSLDGKAPIELIDTDKGIEEVTCLIGRIMHGIPS